MSWGCLRAGWNSCGGGVAALVVLGLLGPAAAAQRDQAVGIFFDPGATARTRLALPLYTFDVFVITFNLDLPSKRADALGGFEVAVQLDARLLVVAREVLPYATVEVTDRDGVADDNWIVATSECLPGHGTLRLMRYLAVLATQANDVVICLDAPSGGGLQPPAPAWLDCDATPHALNYVRDLGPTLRTGCGVVNPTVTVSTETTTWSTLKMGFETAIR